MPLELPAGSCPCTYGKQSSFTSDCVMSSGLIHSTVVISQCVCREVLYAFVLSRQIKEPNWPEAVNDMVDSDVRCHEQFEITTHKIHDQVSDLDTPDQGACMRGKNNPRTLHDASRHIRTTPDNLREFATREQHCLTNGKLRSNGAWHPRMREVQNGAHGTGHECFSDGK